MEDPRCEIFLLGGFAVRLGGVRVPDDAWRLSRARTLLKLLALSPERTIHREQLTELLWPDGDSRGRGLHQVLYTARRALTTAAGEAGPSLTMRNDVVTFAGDPVWVDVDAFEARAADARASPTIEAYLAALELYTGDLLPEDRYEEWAAPRRHSLRETHSALLMELAALQRDRGRPAAAIETLARAVAADPLHEAAHRELMRLFAADGRPQHALAQYENLREELGRRLAADPDPQSRALYREILSSQQAGESGAAPAPVEAAHADAATLPHQPTEFVGRERELAELQGLLGARTRLLTLTGPGGCGKTRLALELAARRDGGSEARLVELAPVADAALVAAETATALGVRLHSERDPIEALASQIGDAGLLLVLDNCEHLIDAAAALVDGLLRACPGLLVLATSRERLRVPGEVAWRVPSLTLPARRDGLVAAELARSEAARLFVHRAGEASGGFAVSDDNAGAIAEICRRLDGMPLALELAAARVPLLSPEQIAQRLGDALGLLRAGSRAGLTRQQTLRGTLEWSHELLDDAERIVYRRLGVFAGSFAVEGVEGICTGDGVPADEALDVLARLAEKSLVQVEQGAERHRYRLLETIRQHALERLEQAGERVRLEAAHRGWYLALAEEADRDAAPGAAAAWPAERVEADHDNLRAALASCIRHDPPSALRLAKALWWFWLVRGYFAEGLRWLDGALAAAPEPTMGRAAALLRASGLVLRLRRGQVERIVGLAAEALEIARRVEDRRVEARGLERLGVMCMGAFAWAEAERAFDEGLALATEVGDEATAVAIKQAQGVIHGCRGAEADARRLFDESLDLLAGMPDERGPLFWAARISPVVTPAGPGGAPRACFEDTFLLLRAVRSRAARGYVLCNIAETSRSTGDDDAARAAFEEALALFRTLGDEPGMGVALNALGNLARSTGDFDAGRAWFAEALALRQAAGDRREIAMTLGGMGLLDLYAGDPAGEEQIAEAMRIFTRAEDGPGLQLLPLNVAAFELDRGDPERARALLEHCGMLARDQGLVRNRGWAAAELVEAALVVGDRELARRAAAEALDLFEPLREERGIRYVRGLEARLGAPGAGD